MSKVALGAIAVVAALVLILAFNGLRGGGGGGGDIAYQNEDYKVPPVDTSPPDIVVPTKESELTELTQNNPLYQQSVPKPVRCEMGNLDLTQASQSQVQEHLNELTTCLMRVWGKPIEDAGWVPVHFKSNVYSGPSVQTPCGKIPDRNAAFCYANQQMYYSMTLPRILPASLANQPYVVETVLAHEFGHGIQGRTGLAASTIIASEMEGSSSAKHLWKRRLELQADCFAGQFVGSIAQSKQMTQTDVDNVKSLLRAIGDDTLTGKPDYDGDHGHAASRVYWMEMGLASTSIGACNSFVSPPERVR